MYADEMKYDEVFKLKVLKAFVSDGVIKALPVQRKKRRVLLDMIVENFEFGITYGESEVNAVIKRYFDDYCTIRREMITEGLMTRNREQYMRLELPNDNE